MNLTAALQLIDALETNIIKHIKTHFILFKKIQKNQKMYLVCNL